MIEVTDKSMRADQRCDRCGAQAYVEVALGSGGTLLFCAHHGTDHWDVLMAKPDAMIADHRPRLHRLETSESEPSTT
ncbi:MAG: hypothetical protein HOV97_05480 [Nonomuraea sp.]|nr:hypothetical protein [Nonomuraea sp.]